MPTLVIPGYQDKALRLPSFSVNDSATSCALDKTPPIVEGIHVLGQDFSQEEISQKVRCHFQMVPTGYVPRGGQPRGGTLELRRTTLVPGQPYKPYSNQAGLWLRVESWLNAVAKAGVKVSPKALNGVLEQLEFGETVGREACLYRAEILAHLQGVSHLTIEKETFIRGLIRHAQADHLAVEKQRYQEWLEGAQVKGMRPLYKAIRSHEQAIRSHEQVLVRPFRDKEAALRPYLRQQQWQAIWKSQSTPVEAILSELHGRAVDEAASMPAITAAQLQTRLHCLPEKAPGVGGWNNRMLKQLPPDALEPLAQFLNHMEATGKAPGQWRVVKFAMLAKNAHRLGPGTRFPR
eukprot:s7935_g3.t1